MAKFFKITLILLIISIASCGRKAPLQDPDNYSRPDFEDVIAK